MCMVHDTCMWCHRSRIITTPLVYIRESFLLRLPGVHEHQGDFKIIDAYIGHSHVLTCIAHALPVDFLNFCTVLSTKLLQIVHNLALVLEAYAKMFLQFPDPWFSTESAYKTLSLSLAP